MGREAVVRREIRKRPICARSANEDSRQKLSATFYAAPACIGATIDFLSLPDDGEPALRCSAPSGNRKTFFPATSIDAPTMLFISYCRIILRNLRKKRKGCFSTLMLNCLEPCTKSASKGVRFRGNRAL